MCACEYVCLLTTLLNLVLWNFGITFHMWLSKISLSIFFQSMILCRFIALFCFSLQFLWKFEEKLLKTKEGYNMIIFQSKLTVPIQKITVPTVSQVSCYAWWSVRLCPWFILASRALESINNYFGLKGLFFLCKKLFG